nr:Ig-like domain-containing protein [Rubricoccus marinus]
MDRSGAAYVFDFDGTSWSETAILRASNAESEDEFGISVSLSGDRAVVGANGEDGPSNGTTEAGAAYVFDFSGGVWAETSILRAAIPVEYSLFGGGTGEGVAVQGDRVLVGAQEGVREGVRVDGAAYVYEFDGVSWAETAILKPSDTGIEDFGWSVSLSDNRALIGTNDDETAYVFDLSSGGWNETATLRASNSEANDGFGFSVSLSGDRALVGAYTEDGPSNGMTYAGAAYTFEFDGTSWLETAVLRASTARTEDFFGGAVSLSGDRGIVGASGVDSQGAFSSGAAYAYSVPFVFRNTPPLAVDDIIETLEDTPVIVSVLDNDTDPDGDVLSVVGIPEQPSNGVAAVRPDGLAVTYAPNPDFFGTDTFNYTVFDGEDQAFGRVEVTVVSRNDAPVAMDDRAATDEDQPVTVAVLANDRDPDGGTTLTVTAVTSPEHGTATVGDDGTVTYTPEADFNGEDSFRYIVDDGDGPVGSVNVRGDASLAESSATVRVTVRPVNDAPRPVDDEAMTDEDQPVTVSVLANDSDPDGDALTVVSLGEPARGAVSTNGTTVTYTPATNFGGTDVFSYTVADAAGATAQATVTVTVREINDAPVFSSEPVTAVREGEPYSYTATAVDVDGDAVAFTAGGLPDWLSLTDNADGTATLAGTPADADVGTAQIRLTVTDGTLSTVQAFALSVTDEENAPVAVADEASTAEDTSVVIDVLANDMDADGDALEITGITDAPQNGTAVVQGDRVVYTPGTDFVGEDAFVYAITDGRFSSAATVRINVGGLNDAPVAVDDRAATDEDQPVTVAVLANDRDPDDGTELTVTAVTSPQHGTAVLNDDGTVTYTPEANFNGEDTFTYTVDDGDGSVGSLSAAARAEDTASVTVAIRSVNDAPLAVDDAVSTGEGAPVTVAVLANDTDIDGDPLEIIAAGGASFGAVAVASGGSSVTYTPNVGFTGQDSFLYTVSDGNGGSAQARVIIAVSDLSPLARNETVTTDEDTALTIDVLANDESRIGGGLVVASVSRPQHGSATIGADGAVLYTPAPDYFGADAFTYVVADVAGATAQASVALTVRPINDAPRAVTVTQPAPGATLVLVGDQSTPVTIVWPTSTDVDGDAVTYRWELSDSDSFSYTPLAIETQETTAETTFGELADILAGVGLEPGGAIELYHRVVTTDGTSSTPGPSSSLTVERRAMTASETGMPTAFALRSAAPNPTGGRFTVSLDMPASSKVDVEFYDTLGRLVLRVEGGVVGAGAGQTVEADLSRLVPGPYIYRVVAQTPEGMEMGSGRATVAR